ALLASVAWNAFAMGKHGSATNYWLEPTFAAALLVAHVPFSPPPFLGRIRGPLAVVAPLLVFAIGIAPTLRMLDTARAQGDLLARIRTACPVDADHTLLASSKINGLELAATHKLTFPDWALAFAVRKSEFPLEVFRTALHDPKISCLLHD